MASLIPAFVDTVVHWNAREFSKDAPLVIKITASILLGSTCTADETHHDDGKGIVLLLELNITSSLFLAEDQSR